MNVRKKITNCILPFAVSLLPLPLLMLDRHATISVPQPLYSFFFSIPEFFLTSPLILGLHFIFPCIWFPSPDLCSVASDILQGFILSSQWH